ncbi:hypothetical protein [Bdellovibrio sp. HCB337]|uniref:hypothetical protein n=1 Tax=Bdellovibrio sp. HCB337 TaxID=3394358 RepID=UPI0039A71104
MKTSLLHVFAFVVLALSLSACTPSSSGNDGNSPGKKSFQGDLTKKMDEIYGPENEPYFTDCDRQWKDKVKEMGSYLEANKSEIETVYKKYIDENPSNDTEMVSMGRFDFRKQKQETVGSDYWEESTYSWSDAYSIYQQAKSEAVGLKAVRLNGFVRGVIVDEENRVSYGENTGLNKDAGPIVKAIFEKVKLCYSNSDCTTPDLLDSEKNFLTQGAESFYVYRLYYSSKSYTFTERRTYIEKLYKWVASYNRRYEFTPGDIIRTNGTELQVPMDLRAFGTAAAQFISYVESVWNNTAGFSIKIVPNHAEGSTYLVKVDDLVGGRAFVQGKKMQLYNYGALRALPHEFGHVLGFRDNYYTTWSSATCAYKDQSNAGDMMSQHMTGQVLPRHWEALKKYYWGM